MRLGRSVRSFGLVTLITALIWLYAEGQDVTSVARTLELTLPARVGQTTVVSFNDDRDSQRVSVHLSGAGTQLSELQQRLGTALELSLSPDDLPQSGKVPLRLDEMLGRAVVGKDSIAQWGVSVSNVQPAVVEVNVEQLETREVRVVLNAEGVELGGERKIEPATVALTAPKDLFMQYLASEDAMYVEAVLDAEEIAQVQEGVPTSRPVALRMTEIFSESKHVSVEPKSVDVTFTIMRQRSSTRPENPLPVIWVVDQTDQYAVVMSEGDRYLSDVTITGPSDLIQRIQDKDTSLRVVARLDLIGEEMLPGLRSKALTQIEFQEVSDGRTVLLYSVPLNRDALIGDGTSDETPAFWSPTIQVKAKNPTVSFTVTQRGE